MYSSHALKHELATKGNQLLRAVVRSFYPPEDSVVIGGLTRLSPDHRPVKQGELAAYLNVNTNYIGAHLQPFVNDNFLSQETILNKLKYTQVYLGGSVLLDKEEALRLIVDIFLTQGLMKLDGEDQTQKTLLEKPLDWLVCRLPGVKSSEFRGNDRIAASTQYTYREDDQVVLLAKVSDGKRKESVVKYTINYESLVYSIKFKMLMIQKLYDDRADMFYCPNHECFHSTTFIKASDLHLSAAMSGSAITVASSHAFNQPRQRTSLAPNSNSNHLVQLSGQPQGTNHSSSLQNLNQSRGGLNAGGLGSGIKRGLTPIDTLDSNSYSCPRCKTTLIFCSGKEVKEENRRFLGKTSHINQLTYEVFEVLKQSREYELKRMIQEQGLNADGSGPAGNKSGVGARGGCSTAADLASRIEKLKTPLPWDELSLADHERLIMEQMKQKEIEEQIARQMKLQEEQEDRERLHQQYLADQVARKRQTMLKRAIFGSAGMEDDPDAELLARFGGDLEKMMEHKMKAASVAKVDALAQYSSNNSKANLSLEQLTAQALEQKDGLKADPDSSGVKTNAVYEDPSSYWLSVNGEIRVRLEDITEEHLDRMTEEEFHKYVALVE